MASMILGNLGASIGGPLGGFLGSALGSVIDSYLFPTEQEGPRMDDLTVTRGEPGSAIPLIYGADRIPGITIGSTDLIETKHKNRPGKGGGVVIITYTYHIDIDFLLCEGPILGVGRIWAEGNLIRGTRYQMDTDTAEYPENIGGIPYPDWYRDHLYRPETIPWTTDPAATATSDGKYYVASDDFSYMVEISQNDAEEILDSARDDGYSFFGWYRTGTGQRSKIVVYWKDTATGYYIPYDRSTAYTGEELPEDLEIEEPQTFTIRWDNFYKAGNDNSSSKTISEEIPDGMTFGGGSFEMLSTVTAYNGLTRADLTGLYVNCSVATNKSAFPFGPTAIANAGIAAYGQLVGTDAGLTAGGNGTFFAPEFEGRGREQTSINYINIPVKTNFYGGKATTLTVSWNYVLSYPAFNATLNATDIIFRGTWIDDNLAVFRDWPDYWNLYSAINDWSAIAVLAYTGPDNITVYPGHFTQPPDPTMEAAMDEEYPAMVGRAHVVFDTLQLEDFGNRIPGFTFEVVQFDDARLPYVLEDLMDRAGVDPANYDLSNLPDTGVESHILGYTIGSSTDYRSAMETILEAYRIDVAEIGNSLVFRERGRPYDYFLDMTEIGAIESGSGPEPLIKFSIRDVLEMPRTLTVSFKDVERNYEANTAFFQRQQGASVQQSSMELAAVLPPAHAKKYARDKMQDLWLERVTASFTAPPRMVYLFPSDLIYIDGASLGKQSIALKLTSVTRGANGILEVEGVQRETTLYVKGAGEIDNTNMDRTTFKGNQTVTNVIPATRMELMDLPALDETHSENGFYIAANGIGDTNWHGALIMRSADEGSTYTLINNATAGAVMGRVVDYSFPTHSSDIIDFTSYLVVRLDNASDDLESTDDEGFWLGRNTCVIGSEVVQYLNAVKQANGDWKLTTFLRGRRGTGDTETQAKLAYYTRFVLLEDRVIKNEEQSLSLRNSPLKYKAISQGSNSQDGTVVDFTNTSRRLMPFPPVWINGTRDVDNNITITWVRQDRLQQGFLNGGNLPMSEDTLSFEIEFRNNLTNALLRTVAVEDATSFVYTAAMQTADGVTPGVERTVHIYQMSSRVGRGIKGVAKA